MAGIEDVMHQAENGEWINQLNKAGVDEREVLSAVDGIRFFAQPGDPEKIKAVIDSSITPTADEVAGVRATVQLLNRFNRDLQSKSQALIHAPEIPLEMKLDVVGALLTFVPQMTGIIEFLELVAKEKELSGLMDVAVLRALRLLREPEDALLDADVETTLAEC